ncbi:hypothetical protein V5799_005909 [Amblyomma americanum]|uniref:Serpin domain-containing protein n=1 Tax=Amblyomma americanum TaxID=6943 RepID=A0AAQ4DXW4_AMBAM
MHQMEGLNAGRSVEWKKWTVEMIYNGGYYPMVTTILANEADELTSLTERLTEYDHCFFFQSIQMGPQVELCFPKLTVQCKTRMKNVLRALGVNDLLNQVSVDLSAMFENDGPAVLNIMHEAGVEYIGREAAAASVILEAFAPPDDNAIDFVGDCSMVFLIRKSEDNLV